MAEKYIEGTIIKGANHIKMQKSAKSVDGGTVFTIIFAFSSALMLFAYPELVKSTAKGLLGMCALRLIPSLFPYIAASKLCTGCLLTKGKKERKSGLFRLLTGLPEICVLPSFLSFLSGFPGSAVAAGDMYKKGLITKSEAERMTAFCGCISPAFCFYYVGDELFGSVSCGIIVYICAVFSGVSAYSLLRPFFIAEAPKAVPETKPEQSAKSNDYSLSVITEAICDSAETVIRICAFAVFFGIIGSVCGHLLSRILGKTSSELLCGIFEVSSGIGHLSALSFGGRLTFASAFCSFGGLSAVFQVASVCEKQQLSAKYFALTRIVSAVVTPISLILFSYVYHLCTL